MRIGQTRSIDLHSVTYDFATLFQRPGYLSHDIASSGIDDGVQLRVCRILLQEGSELSWPISWKFPVNLVNRENMKIADRPCN